MTTSTAPRKLLVEKYRPKTIDDGYVFQDAAMEQKVRGWIASNEIPNLLLTGCQGSGKSTLAKCLIAELGLDPSDVKRVNASLTNGINFIREEIEPWIKKAAFGRFKVVLFEESDRFTQSAQLSLRDITESYSDRVRFIMTANYPKQIVPALHSRFQHIEMGAINMDGIIDLVLNIIEGEDIRCEDEDVLLAHINMFAPDIRRIINSIDECTIDGELHPPTGSSSAVDEGAFIEYMNACDSVDLKDILALTASVDSNNFEVYYEAMYNNSSKFPEEGNTVVLISQYLDRALRAANQRLHLDACLYNIFMEV